MDSSQIYNRDANMKLCFALVVLHLLVATATKMKFGDISNAMTADEVSSQGTTYVPSMVLL